MCAAVGRSRYALIGPSAALRIDRSSYIYTGISRAESLAEISRALASEYPAGVGGGYPAAGGATVAATAASSFGYNSGNRQQQAGEDNSAVAAGSVGTGPGVPGGPPRGVMSCSEVMYQYYPYLYQRPPPPHPHAAPHPSVAHAGNPHTAHHSPARPAPFQPFSTATPTHQYDRVSPKFFFIYILKELYTFFYFFVRYVNIGWFSVNVRAMYEVDLCKLCPF